MSAKFRQQSEYAQIFVIVGCLGIVPVMFVGETISDGGSKAGAVLLLLGYFVVFLGISLLLYYLPAKFTADEKSVVFSILGIKKRILYSSILEIKVTREFIKGYRGSGGHYDEVITFVLREDDDFTCRRTIKVDFDKLADDPETLSETFSDGIFLKLKEYIDNLLDKTEKMC